MKSLPRPLGSLKLHPLTHLGLLLFGIGMSDRLLRWLPLSALPTLILRAIVLLLGLGVYWGIVQNRHPLQKHLGSLNLKVLEIWTIAAWWVFWSYLKDGLLWLFRFFGLSLSSLPTPVTWTLIVFFLLSFVGFPWIVDRLLRWHWQVQPLTPKTLESVSPEAVKLLRSFFATSRRLPLPPLGIIPSPVPLCFSYGWLARPYRILISQGVLDRLSPQEIAELVALELGHFQERSSWVLPWLVWLTQLPYLGYWFLSSWGDRLLTTIPPKASTFWQRSQGWGVQGLTYGLGWGSAVCYGLFKALRFLLLPLSRQRTYYGDRLAAALTGDPHTYSQALLHFAKLQTTDLEERGFTHPWLESLELLLPLGYTTAATLNQLQRHASLEQSLTWDVQSPYRYWLSFNCAHPPTGDRLYQLQHYALRWELPPVLALGLIPEGANVTPNITGGANITEGAPLQRPTWNMFCQTLPYTGVLLGLGLGLIFWFLSALGNLWGLRSTAWVLGNIPVLQACLPLGVALGILLRHNFFFPNLPRRFDRLSPEVYQTLNHPESLPVKAIAIQEAGTLLGRSGLKNWLGQDLWLQSPQGLVRLHYSGMVGVISAFWPGSDRPVAWIGRNVSLSGWLRRGATLWIDVVSLASPSGFRIKSFPGVALLVLAGGLLWWSYTLFLRV